MGANWYQDPWNPAQWRYFDGTQWTSHTHPPPQAPPSQAYHPNPQPQAYDQGAGQNSNGKNLLAKWPWGLGILALLGIGFLLLKGGSPTVKQKPVTQTPAATPNSGSQYLSCDGRNCVYKLLADATLTFTTPEGWVLVGEKITSPCGQRTLQNLGSYQPASKLPDPQSSVSRWLNERGGTSGEIPGGRCLVGKRS